MNFSFVMLKVALIVPYVGTSDPFATLMELGVGSKWVMLVGLSFWNFLKKFRGIAQQNAPVSIRALIGKVKLIDTEKIEVRGFEDKTLIEEKDEGLDEAEKKRVMCGLPNFFGYVPYSHHSRVTKVRSSGRIVASSV